MSEVPQPMIQAFVVCVEILVSRQVEFLLVRPFNTVNCGEFPATPPLSIYADVTDARGRYAIDLQLIDDDGEIAWSSDRAYAFEERNPLRPHRIVLRDLAVTFPKPGRYDLVIFANGASLARHALWATSRRVPN